MAEVTKPRPANRRGRGGRGRGNVAEGNGSDNGAAAPSDDGSPAETAPLFAADEPGESSSEAPARAPRPRRPRGTRASAAANDEVAAATAATTEVATPEASAAVAPPTAEALQAENHVAPAARGRTAMPTGTPDLSRSLDAIAGQLEHLTRLQQEAARRPAGGGSGAGSAPGAILRVGVFVDAANIELASDRLRARFDWRKVLNMLTENRQLVRAIAYSPVHDDPGVSIETQRFVEPFLDKGYKVVTKALKRFQDGSIKANVDIELALDVIEMIDRLDVVCLISGDGDFVRLVEVVQSKGVRVEVVAVGTSTAANLRHAADSYIDLQQRLRELRLGN